jgi:hypothetical protein
MIPEPPPGTDPQDWWSGAAVWGSAPSIDTAKRQVYIATGLQLLVFKPWRHGLL